MKKALLGALFYCGRELFSSTASQQYLQIMHHRLRPFAMAHKQAQTAFRIKHETACRVVYGVIARFLALHFFMEDLELVCRTINFFLRATQADKAWIKSRHILA